MFRRFPLGLGPPAFTTLHEHAFQPFYTAARFLSRFYMQCEILDLPWRKSFALYSLDLVDVSAISTSGSDRCAGRSSIDEIAVLCFESNERKFGRGYTFLFAFHAAQYKLSSIQSYVQ